MTPYDFTLRFVLDDGSHADDWLQAMQAHGCDDAVAGLGRPGRLALAFSRDAASASAAVQSALRSVRRAVPAARLMEASPDLVGLSELASLLGCSRQAMRKRLLGAHADAPSPVHEGDPSLWHLAEVLGWLQAQGHPVDVGLLALARLTWAINLACSQQRLPISALPARLAALVA
jgi:hypothetical protein